jgi:hypothetical protein
LRALSTAAATTAVLTVVDQITVLVLKPKTALLPGYSVQQSPARAEAAQNTEPSRPAMAAGLQRLMTKGGRSAQIQQTMLILRAPALAIAAERAISKRNIVNRSHHFKA